MNPSTGEAESSVESQGSEAPVNPPPPVSLWRRSLTIPRRLYDWVLGWAETRYGTPALALVAFAESSFFPVPPDPLLMALALAQRTRAIFYATVCTASSVLGGLFGYWIGVMAFDWIGQPILEFYGYQEQFEKWSERFNDEGFSAVIIAATTPIPYKLVTITAGACSMSIPVLVIGSVLGRGLRFYLQGYLIRKYGDPIRDFIDRYFGWLCTIFGLSIVGGFVVLKYLA